MNNFVFQFKKYDLILFGGLTIQEMTKFEIIYSSTISNFVISNIVQRPQFFNKGNVYQDIRDGNFVCRSLPMNRD